MKKCIYLKISLIFYVCIFLFCIKGEKQIFSPKIDSINGTVNVTIDNRKKIISKEYILRSGDIINTGMNSFLTINFNNFLLFFNENTTAKITFERRKGNDSLHVNVNLNKGSVFINAKTYKNLVLQYNLFTPLVTVSGNESDFCVTYLKSKKVTVIRNFKNDVSVCPYNKDCINIEECKKILINGKGVTSKILPIGTKEIEEIKKWVANESVFISEKSVCIDTRNNLKNLPPQWKSEPKKQASPNELFSDTIFALDPESTQVQYTLIKGPPKMSLSDSNGVLNFKPEKPGSFEIQLSAKDESGKESILTYTLIVIGKLSPAMELPDIVTTKEVFTIDASKSVNKNGQNTGLKYRFDFTNDGIWDYPSSGNFSDKAKIQHSFLKKGINNIKLQIKDQYNDTAEVLKSIEVVQPLQSKITYSPQYGTVGTEYTLTAINNSESHDTLENVKVRWDFTSDGIWDYPDDGTYTDELSIAHIWDNYGTYKITINTMYNNHENTVSKDIEVYKGISIETLEGPDKVNVNEKISYTCIANDPDFKIVEYSWDLAGVGLSNEISASNSVEFAYKKEGRHTLVCNVRNEKGMSVSESKYILVSNFSTVVDAGGPYNTYVNKPVDIEGYYRDVDNSVVLFLWDFDNDKKFEWNSSKESKTSYSFPREGTYVIRFGVKTDDDKITEDTTIVHVINRPPTAFSGERILAKKNRKISLNGIGKDPDNNIVRYEWDFNCDGIYDWSSTDTGFTETKFSKYSRAVFKVTDSDSASSEDTLHVVICPKGMELIPEGKFCMDIYEWPNEKNKIPVRNITYEKSKEECSKIGKRLCTQNEFISACQGGKDKYIFPYGKKYIDDYCNTYGNRRIDNSIARSGEFPECVSRYDVHDMSGNIAEWTSTEEGDLVRAAGGWWQNADKRSTCKSYVALEKSKKYMFVGFRCCK